MFHNERHRVHLALFLVQVAFGSMAVAGKLALREAAPSAIALVRLVGAAVVFWVLRRGRAPAVRIPPRDLATIAVCALLGMFLNQQLYLQGLRLTSPVNATVLVATVPIFTLFFSIALGRESASVRSISGVAVSFASVLFLTATDLAFDRDTAWGDLLITANALAYALHLVLLRGPLIRYGASTVIALGFSISAVAAVPFGIAPLCAALPNMSLTGWLLIAYVVLIGTVLAYGLNGWALARAPSGMVAVYIYLQPPIAALLTFLVLGEASSPRVWVSLVGIALGIWISAERGR